MKSIKGMVKITLFMYMLFLGALLQAQKKQEEIVWLHPNQGQWDNQIRYKVDLQDGSMFITDQSFTYFLNNLKDLQAHQHSHDEVESDHESFKGQVINQIFIGSNWQGQKEELNSSGFYRNYFQGSDENKWKSGVHSYETLILKEYYNNIDLLLEGKNSELKYSFIVKPNADVTKIKYNIEGADGVFVDEKGNLHIKNRFGEIIENKLLAWNEVNGEKVNVEVKFRVNDNTISYVFPNDYDHSKILVIDPTLVFSSFTGSTSDNWGMSACPDHDGNLYAGGVVFDYAGGSYPTTSGAFDMSFNGGEAVNSFLKCDVSISKFNSTGTNLLYSTYLGGSGNETVNSLVCDQNGDLYVLGSTSSVNFPVYSGAFDNSFNGGPYINNTEIEFSGSDIYITHFNSLGTALIGSTYLGGTDTDGTTTTSSNSSPLVYNYGDGNRGEIIVDESGNVFIVSTSQSTNFPIVNGNQASISGGQDAVICKFNSNLSTLIWSTFFGGTGIESGNSIQKGGNGSVYVAGGTTSQTLPVMSGDDLSFNGGGADGYIARIDGNSGSILEGTFVGSGEYDQIFFVQIDPDNDVYILAQTEANFPITSGLYGVPNSGQLIRKYSENLTILKWSTMVGAGTGHVEISPTAFLVSDCFDIYFAGWGGTINTIYSQANFSTTSGFPVTSDAFQSQTNGSNIYIAVLSPNATQLKYATFMGGVTSSDNHVDGGTSRFDKNGSIYHAVCAACGGNPSGFTSTPGVYSPSNNSSNCNLAAFKFNTTTISTIVVEPSSFYCYPDPVYFEIDTTLGNMFLWDFGDGTTSNLMNPSHLYGETGLYDVQLIVTDSIDCQHDTVSLQIQYYKLEANVVQPIGIICPNIPYQLEASGGISYLWTPAEVLNDPMIANPVATITETTDFTVIVSDSCTSDTLYVTLEVDPIVPSIIADTFVCEGNSIQLFVTNGVSYAWSPVNTLNDATIANPIATPQDTTIYSVIVTTANNCVFHDTVIVDYKLYPHPVMDDLINLCTDDTVSVIVSGAETYNWSPNVNINSISNDSVSIHPSSTMLYYCNFSTECGTELDSVYLKIQKPDVIASNDTIICEGEIVTLLVKGAVSYYWHSPTGFAFPTLEEQNVHPTVLTNYFVVGTDQYGCTDTAYLQVDLFPVPEVEASPDVEAFYDDLIQLSAVANMAGNFTWSPNLALSCVNCANTIAKPNENLTYIVTFEDTNGCVAVDDVKISYKPLLYIPNTFTPDGDSFNNIFNVTGENIKSFSISIFDRWGQNIFNSKSLSESWDGNYQGKPCQDGTYIWKVEFDDLNEQRQHMTGHVNLLR